MSYNPIQEYFQPKIDRKIRIFSCLGRKNNILIPVKKAVHFLPKIIDLKVMTHFVSVLLLTERMTQMT